MPRLLLILTLLLSGAAEAAPLGHDAIAQLLTGARLAYDDGTEQSFPADGRTLFFARDGSQSIGHWELRGDLYCSVWPPSDHWACYGVEEAEGVIAFVAEDGRRTQGRLAR